jgi:predicted nucleic acid-binding protein
MAGHERVVIIDASPLIGLAIVDGLTWLPALFGSVWMPATVEREVLPGVGARGESEIAAAITRNDLRLWQGPYAKTSLPDLDEGEADCIRIGLSVGAANALLIMDERAGRAIAGEHGLRVAGTAALIGLAKKRGLITSAREKFALLHATDFRLSAAIIETVLRDVSEW